MEWKMDGRNRPSSCCRRRFGVEGGWWRQGPCVCTYTCLKCGGHTVSGESQSPEAESAGTGTCFGSDASEAESFGAVAVGHR